jgi:hypothetical protein
MAALGTGAHQPRAAFFAELGSVAILMLALWTVHLFPFVFPLRGSRPRSAISMECGKEKL